MVSVGILWMLWLPRFQIKLMIDNVLRGGGGGGGGR